MACVSDNDLVELLEGVLADARRAEVVAELERCAACRDLFVDLLSSATGSPATAARATASLPEALGGFTIGTILGAGAGGVVVRARDEALGRDVALKLVRSGGDDDDATERAVREARALATVRHPNVVSIHAVGAAAGIGYLAMELIEGESLARRLVRGPLPWRRAVEWFAGVASGLAAVHDAGVIHRDLKPSNLLVDRDQVLRLADFGLAITPAEATPAGTLAYLAPEVRSGAPPDARSDQYALFASLHEALAGVRPSEARGVRLEPGTRWPRSVPARVRAVVERGLAADPAARWPDAGAAAAALRATLAPRRAWWIAGGAVAAAGAIAAVVAVRAVRADGPACDVAPPRWNAAVPGEPAFAATGLDQPGARATRLRDAVGRYSDRFATARAHACTESAGKAGAARACLTRLDERVGAVLGVLARGRRDDLIEAEYAIAALPPPAACALVTAATPVDPAAAAAIAAARAELALGRPDRALATIDGITGVIDAELVRGDAAIAAANPPRAATAYRAALELATTAGREDAAADAGIGLALAIGAHQSEHAAGQAYAVAARAAAERAGDPRRVALARSTLGALAMGTSDWPAARTELDAALAALEQHGEPLDIASTRMRLARLEREVGNRPAARAQLAAARALRVGAVGEGHPLVLLVDENVATLDSMDGKPDAAVTALTTIVASLSALYGPDHWQISVALSSLGSAQLRAGDYAGADVAFTRSLAIRRAARGERDLDVSQAYTNLGSLRYYQGRNDEAAEAYRAAHASARSVLGDDHPDVAQPLEGLGLVLTQLGRFADARDALERAVAIYRKAPGNDERLASALINLAPVLVDLGELDRARTLAEEALAVQTRISGADDIELTWPIALLAELELLAGNVDRAWEYANRALELRVKYSDRPQLVAETHFVLAKIAYRRRDRAGARALARKSLDELGDARPELRATIVAWLADPE